MTKPTGRPVGRPPNKKTLKPKAPARPRGRPPGSKNKPNSLEGFIKDALENPIKPPPKREKKGVFFGPWANKTPEERSEYARWLRSRNKPESLGKGGPPKGTPKGLTHEQHMALVAQARPEAKRILKIMKKNGQVPADLDPRAEMAMAELLVLLKKETTGVRDKATIALGILGFTMPKPTTKSEVTVKSAEDLLDDVADALGLDDPEDTED